MSVTRVATALPIAAVILIGAGPASAQEYPSKPIRIITTAAGGGGDFTSRTVGQAISGPLGQQIIVDNRVSGFLAAELAAKAPPDGYTLLVGGNNTWIAPLTTKASYEVEKDFLPISLIDRAVQIVAVHPSVPAKTIKELIALAKARPGDLNYATTAAAGSVQFPVELLRSLAGVNIVRIGYKGAAAALTGVVGGEVHMGIFDIGVVGPQIKSGRLRGLAVTSAGPSALFPGLPSVAQSGLPGYEWVSYTGLYAPSKTPAAIITRLNQEIVRAVNRPDVKERFLSGGIEPVGSTSEQFVTVIKTDIVRITKLLKEAGIQTQ